MMRSLKLLALLILLDLMIIVPVAHGQGLPAKAFFSTMGITDVKVSPEGEWIAAIGFHDDTRGLFAQQIGGGQITPLVEIKQYIARVDWAGPDTLLVHCISARGTVSVLRLDLSVDTGGRVQAKEDWLFVGPHESFGHWMVDALPRAAEEVLWEFEYRGVNSIHRVRIDELKSFLSKRARGGRIRLDGLLASVEGSVARWIVDNSDVPIAAQRVGDSDNTILVRLPEGKEFAELISWSRDNDKFLALEGRGEAGKLIVRAHADQDTIGVYEMDATTGALGRPIYRNADADVVQIVRDDWTDEPIAVAYEELGRRRVEYLDAYREAFRGLFGSDPGFDSARIVSSSRDRKYVVYQTSNEVDPGTFYLRDTKSDARMKIADSHPSIDRSRLTPARTLTSASSDGLAIESYLTVPAAPQGRRFPLLVMPHGGPIGVRARREYDPIVQYLASWGIAVLQPNYRGSSGFGQKFEEAGKREWARGIEDDIESAVAESLATAPIDPNQICIAGSSYGGFSAIASVVRFPGRYRCAITINGPSDIPLLFETSDFSDSRRLLAAFEQDVGSLEHEREKLLAISPAYVVENVDVPVFVIHGTDDRRVDADHAHRLLLMLETHGKPRSSYAVQGGGHSFSPDQWIDVLPRIRSFIWGVLFPLEPFPRD